MEATILQWAEEQARTRTPLHVSSGERRRPKLLDLFCGSGGCSMGYYLAGFDVEGVDKNADALKQYPFPKKRCEDATEVSLRGYDAVHASPPCQAYTNIIPRHVREKHGHKWAHRELVGPTRQRLLDEEVPYYVIENVMGAAKELHDPIKLDGTMFGTLRVFRSRLFETNWTLDVDRKSDWRNKALKTSASGVTQRPTQNERLVGPEGVPDDGTWDCVSVTRSNGIKIDKYYYEKSSGKRFRSVLEVERYLGVRVPIEDDGAATATETEDDGAATVTEDDGAAESSNKQDDDDTTKFFAVYGDPGRRRGSVEEWRMAMGIRWMDAKPLAQAIPPPYTEYIGRKLLETMGYAVDYPPVTY